VLAHVLPNNFVPISAQWGAIALAAVGGLGILRRRSAVLDTASWSAFSVGALAIVAMVGIAMFAPQPPGYSLSLAMAQQGTSPMPVTVCARYPSGSATKTPDGDHVLTVLVDGAQVGYQLISQFAVEMTPGHHRLRVELLSRDHREFNPVVAVDTQVTVTGTGPTADWMPCPGM
jgi:hypothetical protein